VQGAVEIRIEGDLPPGLIAQRAQLLSSELAAAGVPAHPVRRPAAEGERGGELVMGALVVQQFGGWAMKTLLDRLWASVRRDGSVKVTLKRPDGAEITLEAQNTDRAEVEVFLRMAKDGLG